MALASACLDSHTEQGTLGDVGLSRPTSIVTRPLGPTSPKAPRGQSQLAAARLAAVSDIVVAARDGRELYVFDSRGKHRSTVDAITQAEIYHFGYDLVTGELTRITDANAAASPRSPAAPTWWR